jgi:phenol 2-monooxygenase (NADPH)
MFLLILLLLSAFQGYGNFSSGVGIHYAPSSITRPDHQSAASNLTIGKRLLPQNLLRAADARVFNIQDYCLADTRWKLFVFAGDLSLTSAKVEQLVKALTRSDSFLSRAASKGWDSFDIVTVCKGTKDVFNYLDVPRNLRSHWSKYVSCNASHLRS